MKVCSPVVVGWNGVGDPGGIRIGINDANRWDVVESTLVEQDVVFEWVHADDEIGSQHWPIKELFFKARNFFVELVDHLCPAPTYNLLAVGDASGDPALEQMVALGQLGGARNGPFLSVAGSHKQNHACPSRDLLDDLGGTAQVGGRHLERDDVHALPYAVDVTGICRIPEGSDMALVGFGGQEKFEGDVGGGRRVVQQGVGLVVRHDDCSQLAHLPRLLLVHAVLFRDIVSGRGGRAVGFGVDRGHWLGEVSVELGLYRLQLLQAVLG